MTQKRLWISAGIIALVIFIGFAISIPHTQKETILPKPEEAAAVVPPVTVHDVFKKGTHTITGSVVAPNACTTVSVQPSLIGSASSTQGINIALTMPADTGVCLQLPTPITFSTTFAAPAHLPITATVNGAVASTTNS